MHYDDDDDYRAKLDLSVWAKVTAHARPYRWQLAGMAACGLAVAAIDVLIPLMTGWLIDAAIAGAVGERLLTYGLGYAALFAVLAACVWAFIVLAGQISTGVAFDLRQASFGRLQELSFAYFDARPVGWLVTRLTADCHKLSNLLPWFLLDMVWGTSLVLGITVAMLLLD